ncbi:sensor histidine kinase [Azospirillum picis]|uniref:histidine kinase n=1 Tax=Azospirillum picis TaxID=488438 RepID=A0ABU0MJ66_9PROT|nr:HAMP domain-containing sensor histidine kinase [Azospirillum picis]MBP2299706.1 signal transduction histidine kinase [Azospirillum picis]MDQ0533502.1 signal transduction histidine kinase [Azospirillum picis]
MTHEDDLTARIRELEDAVRARDDFLAIAAHELRNPMYALSLILDTVGRMAQASGDGVMVGAMDQAEKALKRYVERATTLLDVSRLNAGHGEIHVEPFDLAALVRQTAESYAAEAAHTDATLRLDLPRTLPGRWDRLAMEQIVGNLLSNAIRYGAGGPVDLLLAREGDEARLTVRDQGPGIPPEAQDRIFGRFEQVVSSRKRAGFGIGLWLVRSLLQAHGGSIAVDSRPGDGAAFTIRLPLDATPKEPQSP